jgi:S-adenosylhomocysteine hydrolase
MSTTDYKVADISLAEYGRKEVDSGPGRDASPDGTT